MAVSDMRGALVLFEGLPPTVIDSQVLTHVRLARERLGIDIAVVSFACSPSLFEVSQARLDRARSLAGGDVHLARGVRPAMPGSLTINRRRLAGALDRLGGIAFVHARADYAAAVTGPLARRRDLPMLWDCRGDARAELQERFADAALWLKPAVALRSAAMRRELRIAGESCAGACFVTPQLRDLMAEHLADQPCWVIPCLAPETEFFFDPALRARARHELRIGAGEAVYIYSGSLAGYQGFDETVVVFGRVLAAGRTARLVVLTPDADRARQRLDGLPAERFICRSVAHQEVNGYLNAADFGILLRDATPVNHVAFPTKFAEYALTGLKVVMKDAPPACVDAARRLGNYTALGAPAVPLSDAERAAVAAAAVPSLGRIAAMPAYADIYGALAAT
jgi:hypothetical protein